MRKTLTLLAALALAGCATAYVDKSPGQVTRLKDGQTVSITGRIDSEHDIGLLTETTRRNLAISINDTPVIDAPINAKNPAGEFAGKWQDKSVSALCHSERHGKRLNVHCVVLVDNERTVTLTF